MLNTEIESGLLDGESAVSCLRANDSSTRLLVVNFTAKYRSVPIAEFISALFSSSCLFVEIE